MGYAGHRFKPRLEPLALQESKQNPETKLSYFQVPFIQKGFVALLQTELCPSTNSYVELPSPSVTVSGDKDFMEVIKVK